MDQQVAIEDWKRVAGELKSRSVGRSLCDPHGTLASAERFSYIGECDRYRA